MNRSLMYYQEFRVEEGEYKIPVSELNRLNDAYKELESLREEILDERDNIERMYQIRVSGAEKSLRDEIRRMSVFEFIRWRHV